jgi:hypothetical protein
MSSILYGALTAQRVAAAEQRAVNARVAAAEIPGRPNFTGYRIGSMQKAWAKDPDIFVTTPVGEKSGYSNIADAAKAAFAFSKAQLPAIAVLAEKDKFFLNMVATGFPYDKGPMELGDDPSKFAFDQGGHTVALIDDRAQVVNPGHANGKDMYDAVAQIIGE